MSQNGIPVNGGSDPNKNSVPIEKLPPQIDVEQKPIIRRNNKAGIKTDQIG